MSSSKSVTVEPVAEEDMQQPHEQRLRQMVRKLAQLNPDDPDAQCKLAASDHRHAGHTNADCPLQRGQQQSGQQPQQLLPASFAAAVSPATAAATTSQLRSSTTARRTQLQRQERWPRSSYSCWVHSSILRQQQEWQQQGSQGHSSTWGLGSARQCSTADPHVYTAAARTTLQLSAFSMDASRIAPSFQPNPYTTPPTLLHM